PVTAVQARLGRPAAQGADAGPPGPEAQALLQALQVVAATLDGDDSVTVVEALLQGRVGPAAAVGRASAGADLPRDLADRPAPAPAPPAAVPPGRLLKWLAASVAVAYAAAG